MVSLESEPRVEESLEDLKIILVKQKPNKPILSNDDSIEIQVMVSNSDEVSSGIIKYSTDGEPGYGEAELIYDELDKLYKADLGSFDDGIEVYFEVEITDNQGEIYRDNNRGKKYRFSIGRNGGSMEALEIQEIKNQLGDYPLRSDITKYQPMRKFLKNHKIYISLTTSPQRISKITHVLDTLDLTNVEEVLLVLPKRYGRNNEPYEIPDEVSSYDKLRIIEIEEDLGPITKLLPAVEYIKDIDPGSIVITIDDDMAYAKAMVNELALSVALNDGSVVGGSGNSLSFWEIAHFGWPKIEWPNYPECGSHSLSECDVIEGFGAVAYPVHLVDVDLMKELSGLDRNCYLSDDLVISFALAQKGVKRLKIATDFYSLGKVMPFPFGFDVDALHMGGGAGVGPQENINEEKYQICNQKIMEHIFSEQFEMSEKMLNRFYESN